MKENIKAMEKEDRQAVHTRKEKHIRRIGVAQILEGGWEREDGKVEQGTGVGLGYHQQGGYTKKLGKKEKKG